MHLRHAEAELVVGVHGGHAVLYWLTHSPDDAVTTGGTNDTPESYGLDEILLPTHSEISLDTAITAAGEFHTSGRQPTSVQWTNYGDAMTAMMGACALSPRNGWNAPSPSTRTRNPTPGPTETSRSGCLLGPTPSLRRNNEISLVWPALRVRRRRRGPGGRRGCVVRG